LKGFELKYTPAADSDYNALEKDASKVAELRAVNKCLGYMETNLRHPSLNTHKLDGWYGPKGEQAFEAYAENKTPSAYRVIWFYGPGRGQITIAAIVPHL
jgi:hypothetical protein